jgi:hypothetical protein
MENNAFDCAETCGEWLSVRNGTEVWLWFALRLHDNGFCEDADKSMTPGYDFFLVIHGGGKKII